MVGSYGLPDFIRFTIGTEEEMRAVVASLSAFMKG
jgi:histidinol-phosphate/aromatic aminotransferase/cobyric acid decarboxylase-like protein